MTHWLYAVGERTVRADAAHRAAVMDLCLQNAYTYHAFCWEEDGSIRFSCSSVTARCLERACRRSGIPIEVGKGRGVPYLLAALGRRAGLCVGAVAVLVLLFLSGRFVWDVRVTGNETMRDSEVIAELRACGFGVGSYLPDVRTAELETRVPMLSDRIAWISIYLDGTVARVQVLENRTAPPVESGTSAGANLVAACDGQIELLQIYRGNVLVTRGQAVRKGELLVSGLYDSQAVGIRYTRAAGEVLARTEHRFCVEIPLAYTQKVYDDHAIASLTLNFFDFSVKIFENSRNQPPMCDIIEKDTNLNLPGLHPIPVSLCTAYAYPYREVPAARTETEALELAYAALARDLDSLSQSAELLEKQIRTTLLDDRLVLECTVQCIQNIARQVDFDVPLE